MPRHFAASSGPRPVIKRMHSEEHLIADDVAFPISEIEKKEAESAMAVLGKLRERALAAMKEADIEVADESDGVVMVFDYRFEGVNAVVQVLQIAE